MAATHRRMAYLTLGWLLSIMVGLGLGTMSVSAETGWHWGGWRDLPSIPNPPGAQQEHAVVALDNKIYVLGGVEAVPDAQNCFPGFPIPYCSSRDVDVYDIAAGRWRSAAPLPSPHPQTDPEAGLLHPGAAVVDGKIYVLGGLARDFPIDPAQGHFDFPWHAVGNSYVYDPRTNAWRSLAPMPAGTERAAGAIAARDGKIYVVGGTFCHEGQNGECFSDSSRNRMVTAYDTCTDRWQRLADLPQPRDHLAGAFFGDSLYVFGGRYDTLDPRSQFNSVFVYDVRAGRWSQRAPMPTRRSEAWLGVVGNDAHLMGGSGNPVAGTDGTFATHEVYDVAHDRWSTLPPMPHPRHGPGTAVVGNSIFLPGGSTSQTVGVTPIFDTFQAQRRWDDGRDDGDERHDCRRHGRDDGDEGHHGRGPGRDD